MFDRNRSSNSTEMTDTPVHLLLVDGSDLNGRIAMPATTRLEAFINNADGFVPFTDHEAATQFIAKSQIASIRPLAVPRASQLSRRLAEGATFDPYNVLEVDRGSGPDAIRQAYLMKARLYHPDRFAGIDMPREMASYLKAMQQRINLAYEALSEGKTAAA